MTDRPEDDDPIVEIFTKKSQTSMAVGVELSGTEAQRARIAKLTQLHLWLTLGPDDDEIVTEEHAQSKSGRTPLGWSNSS